MTSMVKAKVENGIVPSKDLFVATNAAPISCTTEQIEVRRFEKSLEDFCIDTRLRFEQRFPGIGYSSVGMGLQGNKGGRWQEGQPAKTAQHQANPDCANLGCQ